MSRYCKTENASGSDSDTNTGESPEYYHPISAIGEDDDDDEDFSDQNSDDYHHQNPNFHPLPNGYAHCVENGVSSLDLTDDEEEEKEEEEERMREASDSAIRRAFREDESRRNAPLPPENATRVMEAMRGISFGGFTPNWTDQVPEDRWINELGRLRRSPSSTTTSTSH